MRLVYQEEAVLSLHFTFINHKHNKLRVSKKYRYFVSLCIVYFRYSHPIAFNLNEYQESKSWTLLSGRFFVTSMKFQCCKNPFSGVTLEIKLRRNSLFYGFILLFPITMAWIPVLFSFVAPTATGERISFSISVLLTLVFYIEVCCIL